MEVAINTVYKAIIISLVLFSLVSVWSCRTVPSDVQVEDAIAGIKRIYTAFFSILEQQKYRPNNAMAEAENYIINNRYRLIDYGRVLGRINRPQEPLIRQYRQDIDLMIREAGEKLGPKFASDPEIKTRVIHSMEWLSSSVSKGIDDKNNAAIRIGSRVALAYMREIILLDVFREKYAAYSSREKLLEGWCSIIARYGADREVQDTFKAEIKEKLDWW